MSLSAKDVARLQTIIKNATSLLGELTKGKGAKASAKKAGVAGARAASTKKAATRGTKKTAKKARSTRKQAP